MFRRMPWSVPRCHEHLAKCELIAVFDFFRSEAVVSAAFPARVNLCRFKTRAKLARAADQISMNMRLENMRDGEPRFACHLYIDLHIGSWIEDRRHSFVVVTKQIGKFGDTLGLNGFKNERHRKDLTRMRKEVQYEEHLNSGMHLRSLARARIHCTSTVIGRR